MEERILQDGKRKANVGIKWARNIEMESSRVKESPLGRRKVLEWEAYDIKIELSGIAKKYKIGTSFF